MLAKNDDLKCEHFVPDPAAPPHEAVSRWSHGRLDRPAIVATPKTEDDIINAVLYARENGLCLIPANGGHCLFVPINSNTLYLDMSNFNRVTLDESTGTVHMGGGVLTGRVVAELTAHGWYTLWPNSDAVGFVGCLLGGGSSSMNGLHGFMIDAIVSVRLVTADGKVVRVSEKSQGDELDLFHALCGAGHGLGVVTSVTMHMWPMAALKMPEDKIWTRTLIFPPPAVAVAAETFAKLRPEAEKLSTGMVFLRAPPSAPMPGAPMIVLSAAYRGPWDEAERHAELLFNTDVVGRAVKAETAGVPFPLQNKGTEAFNVHGGYKDFASCFLKDANPKSIVESFNRWLQFTNDNPDAMASTIVLGRSSTEKLVANGETSEGSQRYFESRDRGLLAYAVTQYSKPETTAANDTFIKDYLAILRRYDDSKPRTFANNLRKGMSMEEVHEKDRIAKLEHIRETWDPEKVFWSPYGRGWSNY